MADKERPLASVEACHAEDGPGQRPVLKYCNHGEMLLNAIKLVAEVAKENRCGLGVLPALATSCHPLTGP